VPSLLQHLRISFLTKFEQAVQSMAELLPTRGFTGPNKAAKAHEEIEELERAAIGCEPPIGQRPDGLFGMPKHPPDVSPVKHPNAIERKVGRNPNQVACTVRQDANFVRIAVAALLEEAGHLGLQSFGARHG